MCTLFHFLLKLSVSDFVHSLAVVKKNDLLNVRDLRDLRGLKACFPRVGSLAGWTIPIYRY